MKMRSVVLRSDSKMLLAAPARPMPREISDALGKMIANHPDVLEAHLPFCLIQNVMQQPAQVLVVVFKSSTNLESVSQCISARLLDILPFDTDLLVLPLEYSNPVCSSVRNVHCRIYQQPPAGTHV
jgi:hypothetical protein